MIQGTVLFGAFFIVMMSLIVDILYAFLDPRVRYWRWPPRCSRSRTSRSTSRPRTACVKAVDGISYTVDRGQTLGIVGESGSGKSVSSLTVMGLTRARNARISGTVRFDGKDLLGASEDEMRSIRGNEIAMIFQDPLSSLHPFYKVRRADRRGACGRTATSRRRRRGIAPSRCSSLVGIPEPRKRVGRYPHEFSGGMRQRAMIAMALVERPQAADRRRADDGARRDRPGADPRR